MGRENEGCRAHPLRPHKLYRVRFIVAFFPAKTDPQRLWEAAVRRQCSYVSKEGPKPGKGKLSLTDCTCVGVTFGQDLQRPNIEESIDG